MLQLRPRGNRVIACGDNENGSEFVLFVVGDLLVRTDDVAAWDALRRW